MKFFTIIPGNTNWDFLGKSKYFIALSVILMAGTFYLFLTKGFNYGIDFTGGTVVQIKFNEATPPEKVRSLLEEVGEDGASVVSMGEGTQEYLITVRGSDDAKRKQPLADRLGAKLGAGTFEIEKSDEVGPKVGKELKASALRSLFYSVLLIMIYIWFRFDFRFAPGATLAMVHDLILAAGFFLLTGREFTISSVAALLTIAGYSVNDTIVIYDRVREIIKDAGDGLPLAPTINRALNLTLSRTILTSLLTMLSIIGIMVYTTGELQNFAFAIGIGVFAGTYSTLFIASPVTLLVEKMGAGKPKSIRART